jgi:isoleucyl-tRNA synthetase
MIGVEAFNEKARSMVLKYVNDWEQYIERVGRWVDFKNSYKTMDNTFIESVWWALKKLSDKKQLYEGNRVLMYCPHCETPLAKAEIAMDNTYKDVTEEAVTVKFKVKNPEQLPLTRHADTPVYFLAWTTTPWTLPGNVALAVGKDINYVALITSFEIYILAEEAYKRGSFQGHLQMSHDKTLSIKGSELAGFEYEPLFQVDALATHPAKKYVVLPADFVTTEDGTGIVHTAVMYGEDDYELGKKEKLPMVQLLHPNGTYNDKSPVFLQGKYIKAAEKEIKGDIENRGLLFEKKNHTHSYPHCYRCGTPLIYNAVPSWFIDIQSVKKKMLAENKKVNWVPKHLKDGRFKNIVENAPDWTISRNRFWASPLPIWKEKGGDKYMVIGSLDELSKRAKKSGNIYFVMRHGEAESNVLGILNADHNYDNHLTAKGQKEVIASAKKIKQKIDIIFVSPLVRTRDTAALVATELGIEESNIIVDTRLRECGVGAFEQKSIDTFHEFFGNDVARRFAQAPEGGETLSDVRQRAGDFLFDIENKYSDKNILIITHGDPSWMLFSIAEGCDERETLELRKKYLKTGECKSLDLRYVPRNKRYELDLHRPYTDSLILRDAAGKEYERIPEVIDCWVESGSMAFAQWHYPFEHKKDFEKGAPGDFIAEYIAQTRTWFYYMHALGALLFDRRAFKNVVSTGTVLAANGDKISKSKRNYTDPLSLLDQYGADSFRFYLMSSPVMQAEDVKFRDEDVREVHNRVVRMFWNCYQFYELYASEYDKKTKAATSKNVLDRWILALLSKLIADATVSYDAYDLPQVCREIESFVDAYSTWYVRRSRERVKSPSERADSARAGDDKKDKHCALATQREVLLTVSKIIAPIMPFMAESVYQGVMKKETSVHLAEWPKAGTVNTSLIDLMAETRRVVSSALELRAKAAIKVRQPLQELVIPDSSSLAHEAQKEFRELIRDEVNVKEIVAGQSEEVVLDTTITEDLRREGLIRDLIRDIQDKRKELRLAPKDVIKVTLEIREQGIEGFAAEIGRAVNAKDISIFGGKSEKKIVVEKV